jgi:DNA-binding MarR family transcriptional regulator/ribosomal protein S18 acetylase RimI-like enzyme
MDVEAVAQVRRFNRLVTQRIGALSDRFLARDRSLGEARLLWEIGAAGPDGRDVRSLRSQLSLDSGYLSRLLQALQVAGLITVGPKESDRRVRIARLTKRGLAERAVLDRRSDELAESILAPLSARQQTRLTAAMAEVERLLTVTMVEIAPIDSTDPRARYCLNAYFAELDQRFETGFDPELSIPAGVAELRSPTGALLVATLRGEPVGCGGLKFRDGEPTEIKRMWIAPTVRGLGVGRRLLAELEIHAARQGARAVRLETNKSLVEAISLYQSAGFIEIEPYNDEPYAHHWFEKQLAADLAGSAGR